MDCLVHGVAKSWTGLKDFHFQDECLADQAWVELCDGRPYSPS